MAALRVRVQRMIMLASAMVAAAAATAGISITTPLPGNKRAQGAQCQSWWCPALLETMNSTLLFGCCKPADDKVGVITGQMARSTDHGKSWGKPVINNHAGQGVYSYTSDTIVMIVGWPNVSSSTTTVAAGARQRRTTQECTYYLEKYCKADAGKGTVCLSCLEAAGHQVLKRGLCTATEVSRFCTNGTLPPAPPPVPRGVAWASQLPPLRANELAACSAGVTKSTDGVCPYVLTPLPSASSSNADSQGCPSDGVTWSQPTILVVNGSLGPHYGGNGLNHGVQLQNGPHKGRLALAERFDCPGVDETPPYWRSYVLYSDDEVCSALHASPRAPSPPDDDPRVAAVACPSVCASTLMAGDGASHASPG